VNLVVDTNIVFSAIISDKGKIGELLLNKPLDLHFSSPTYLLTELDNHTGRILAITGYSPEEYQQIKYLVTKHINFIDPDRISRENWGISNQLLKDIDENDASFLALNMELDSLLWTGDKKLIKGLESKNYTKLITTEVLYSKYFAL